MRGGGAHLIGAHGRQPRVRDEHVGCAGDAKRQQDEAAEVLGFRHHVVEQQPEPLKDVGADGALHEHGDKRLVRGASQGEALLAERHVRHCVRDVRNVAAGGRVVGPREDRRPQLADRRLRHEAVAQRAPVLPDELLGALVGVQHEEQRAQLRPALGGRVEIDELGVGAAREAQQRRDQQLLLAAARLRGAQRHRQRKAHHQVEQLLRVRGESRRQGRVRPQLVQQLEAQARARLQLRPLRLHLAAADVVVGAAVQLEIADGARHGVEHPLRAGDDRVRWRVACTCACGMWHVHAACARARGVWRVACACAACRMWHVGRGPVTCGSRTTISRSAGSANQTIAPRPWKKRSADPTSSSRLSPCDACGRPHAAPTSHTASKGSTGWEACRCWSSSKRRIHRLGTRILRAGRAAMLAWIAAARGVCVKRGV